MYIYLSTDISLLKHCILPKKTHTKIWENSDYLTERHISYIFLLWYNDQYVHLQIPESNGEKNPQKNTTENPTENRKSGQDRTVYHTHKGHLGCGTDRSWYVASAFRLAWTWFGVRGEGVTLSGCFNTPELEHTPT